MVPPSALRRISMGAFASIAKRARDPLYSNGLALVANAGVSAALGFLFWIVVARRFNADALGIGAAVVSAATLAALLGKAGFDAAVIRYAPAHDRRGAARILGYSLLGTFGLTSLVAAGLLALSAMGVPALAPLLQPAYAAGFVVLAVATSFAWILDAYFIAEQRGYAVLLRNVAFNGVKLFVPLFIAFEWGGRAIPLAWSIGLAASLAVTLAMLPRVLGRHKATADVPARGAVGYSMRNYALNLSEFVPGLVLPLLVLHTLGAEENARFYLAWTVATVAFLASKAIAQSAFAAMVRAKDERASVLKSAALSSVVLGPAAVVLYFFGAPLLSIFGAHYSGSAPLLRLLALSIPGVVAANIYLAYLKARDEGWELTLLPIGTLALLLILIPIALAWRGVEGVGLVWLGIQTTVGLYATARLAAKFRRNHHVFPRTGLRRHPHQG